MGWPTDDTALPRRIRRYGYSIFVMLVTQFIVILFVHDYEMIKLFVNLFVTFLVVIDFMYVRDCLKEERFALKTFDLPRWNNWVRREDAPILFWWNISSCCIIGVWATIAVARYWLPLLQDLFK